MTLCALQQTEHVNLASERYGAMLWLYGAAVGVAIISSETYSANIISISTGALAVTLPDITVQCPTLLACQKKKEKKKRTGLTLQGHASLPLDTTSLCEQPEEEEEEEEEEGWLLHPTPAQ